MPCFNGTNRTRNRCLSASLEIEPEHEEALFWLAKLYLQAGKVESALACYDRLIQLNAWNQPAWESLIALLQKYANKDIHSTSRGEH
jgi:tetratricopeptide (TPR) repeat protein